MPKSQRPFQGTLGQRLSLALGEALGPDYVSGAIRAFYICGIRTTVAHVILVLSALPVFVLDLLAGGHSRSLQMWPILVRAGETLFATALGLFVILVVRAVHRALDTMDGPGGLTPPHTEALDAIRLYFEPVRWLYHKSWGSGGM